MNHPRPLRFEPNWEGDDVIEQDGDLVRGEHGCSDYEVVAQCVDRRDAEHIVRCVNAHDQLMEACKAASEAIAFDRDYSEAQRAIEQALALAGETK